MKNTQKILSISSEPIAEKKAMNISEKIWIPQEIVSLLSSKNGFYAFYSSLHIYPMSDDDVSIERINIGSNWKDLYGDEVKNSTSFGQDVFGCQFLVSPTSGYFKLDLETGQKEYLGETLEEFFSSILEDPECQTGYTLAYEWQNEHGALKKNHVLSPKIPFLMGGEYSVGNLFEVTTNGRIELASDIFSQTKDLSDGQQVQIKAVP